jgi:hypothetical protein
MGTDIVGEKSLPGNACLAPPFAHLLTTNHGLQRKKAGHHKFRTIFMVWDNLFEGKCMLPLDALSPWIKSSREPDNIVVQTSRCKDALKWDDIDLGR